MCGINAILGPSHHDKVAGMNGLLRHRGPDGSGLWQDKGISLGSTRLRILDLDPRGDMPMASPCGRYRIVFNGEIYNYRELKSLAADYPFASSTDTEVLFALLQREGPAALKRARGMFALAFWDGLARTLLLARDRLGVKPLFYAWQDGCLAVSSELQALRLIPGLDSGLDRNALHHYLSLLCVPGPATIFPAIRRFPPAHFALAREGEALSFHRYWDLSFDKLQEPEALLAGRVRESLGRAVSRRLVADVPLGVFLSGGVDSTLVAALMAKSSTGQIKSFCMGFEAGLDETGTAEQNARILGTDHRSVRLGGDALWKEIPAIVSRFSEPFAGGLPMWFISREMRCHATVALSGTGGDEMFGNYGRIAHLRPGLGFASGLRSSLRVHGQAGIDYLFKARGAHALCHGAPAGHLYHEKCCAIKEWQKSGLLAEPGRQRTDAMLDDIFWEKPGLELEDRLFWLDLNMQLSCEFLHAEDLLSMASSLETRHPFLDQDFLELMASVPCAIRSEPGDPKKWMRSVFRDLIPEPVLNKPKSGFMMPYGQWLRTVLKPMAERLFEPGNLASQGIFRPEAVTRLWTEHQQGACHDYELWPIFMFQIWLHQQQGRDFPGAGG